MCLVLCLCGTIQMKAQDSLRIENLSCVNPANSDVQEGLVFSMIVEKEKKDEVIHLTLENYPNYLEPLELTFGRTISKGSGTVVWLPTGGVSLSRESKGTRWVLLFGAASPEKTLVPCQLVKVTANSKEIQQYQLAFATIQAEQIFEFLKRAIDRNILKQMVQ